MSLKIMVVDDEPVTLKLVRSLAAPLGHTVLSFENYQEAGQRAEQQRFDLALVGMRVPELEGLELARRIRNSQHNRETTIAMLSATDDVESLRKAFGEGADFVPCSPPWNPVGGISRGARPVYLFLRRSSARGMSGSFPCAA